MFDRLTPEARRSIFFAHMACQHDLHEITTEHLLRGLMREDIALVNRFLNTAVSEELFGTQVLGDTAPLLMPQPSLDVRFSDGSRRVLTFASQEADRVGSAQIGIEHLLLGLLQEQECPGAQMLRQRGADIEHIRTQMAKNPYQPLSTAERMRLEISRIQKILASSPPRSPMESNDAKAAIDPLEQYTLEALRVISSAKCEAARSGAAEAGTEHLLVALLREERERLSRLLPLADSTEMISKEVRETAGIREDGASGKTISDAINLPLSEECKRVQAYADEEAKQLGSKFIGPEHLFLGMLREEACFAARVMREHGAELAHIRAALALQLGEGTPGPPTRPAT
jgi:ATP-dependent Clp protease ATP-binding subunit ClpA